MTAEYQVSADTLEFQQDYQNYLSSSEDMDRLLIVETLSERNQRMAKPAGGCGCDGCNRVEPPIKEFHRQFAWAFCLCNRRLCRHGNQYRPQFRRA